MYSVWLAMCYRRINEMLTPVIVTLVFANRNLSADAKHNQYYLVEDQPA